MEGIIMSADHTAALLFRLNGNINALGSAIEEIGSWIEHHGSIEASDRIARHLQVLADNSEFIAEKLVELVSRQE
jgi:hypothetical protein